MNDQQTRSHPSFGMARIARVSGHANLFGSEFNHQHFMTIEIKEAEEVRSLHRTWYFARKTLCEVSLSEAQFCQLMTSPNTEGVPVTIRYCAGDDPEMLEKNRGSRPPAPAPDSMRVIERENNEHVDNLPRLLNTAMQQMDQLKEKGKANKGELATVISLLAALQRELTCNLDFMKDQLREHMENTVAAGKSEIEAYMNEVYRRAGVTAIQSGAPFQLTGPKETE